MTAAESGQASSLLIDLRAALRDVPIPDLDIPRFADRFAQTLAYGLFATRVNHWGALSTFRCQDAARETLRTNPSCVVSSMPSPGRTWMTNLLSAS